MEDLNKNSLKLFYDEELFIIKEKAAKTTPKSQIVSEPEPEPYTVPYKGSNKKGVIVLFENSSQETFDPFNEALLLNILKAVGLSIDDVAMVNQLVAKTKWREQLQASKVVAFGVSQDLYGFTSERYVITNEQNIQWLFSHSLDELASDKVLKGKLWAKLQELFPA